MAGTPRSIRSAIMVVRRFKSTHPHRSIDPTRVAAGLKAAIHNPNVSEEAKERAAERLESMGQETGQTLGSHTIEGLSTHRHATDTSGTRVSAGDDETHNRQMGGYKATLKNPNVSEEAKAHAREILKEDGYTFDRPEGATEEEHETRVLAGYKAALHNDRVSAEAKAHARQYLKEHGAL
ncbi:hypothetical protein JAAARDRAFT_194009 [Jaapia argillacea MUCL 33604]|uniref:Conidiation protein 6 n=1 Tax=Jaapia argillacea MUCL 33604 TaxID=933084 RepID=A0A067Q2K4_9AGAM|nr:hypothetical protein JAAARDRAFT_194009 [Jaapia argillacea MUCL 33604]